MEPHMAPSDRDMFYRYVDNATVYLEFGSGGSTAAAAKRCKQVFSVESDSEFYKNLSRSLPPNVTYVLCDLDSPPNKWGYPGPTCTNEKMIEYSSYYPPVPVDLVLIDGRFRVACCLKLHEQINDDTVVLFDDFLDRPQYHIVLEYYTIIEQTASERMVALKRKSGVTVPQSVIEKYEKIAN